MQEMVMPHFTDMKKNAQKILVIRLSSIGDILLASPLIRSLRRRFPEATIDFVVKSQFADLLRTNPHLDTIFTLDTKQGRSAMKTLRRELRAKGYDLVVDIHNNFRSGFLRRLGARIVKVRKYKFRRFLLVKFGWNLYRRVRPVYRRYIDAVADFGVADDGQGLEFFPDAAVQKQVDDLLRRQGWRAERTVCMAPGASVATKRWPHENFAVVAGRLMHDFDAQILLIGDARDAELTAKINQSLGGAAIDVAGQLNLMQSACALNRAAMALTNDSGLMHLATALGKPTAAIFGPTVRELGFFPVGEQNMVIENERLACRPCTHVGRRTCPKKHFKCMSDIPPQAVLTAATHLLRKSLS